MIGRFLEISVEAPDIAASVEFYQALGLVQARVGDTWTHRYGVLTDGNLVIGLHDYSFPSPSLTYVRPGLKEGLAELRQRAGSLAFAKTGEDEFNEAGFTDPDGQMVTVLEARTFSPPEIARPGATILGHFSEVSLPVKSLPDSIAFWESMGFVLTGSAQQPVPRASLTSDGLNLGLYATPRLRRPALTFRETDMDARIEYIGAQGFRVTAGTPISDPPPAGASLQAPEGTWLFLIPGEPE